MTHSKNALLRNPDLNCDDWKPGRIETDGSPSAEWEVPITQYPIGYAPRRKRWFARLFGKRRVFLTPTGYILVCYETGSDRYEWKTIKPDNVSVLTEL